MESGKVGVEYSAEVSPPLRYRRGGSPITVTDRTSPITEYKNRKDQKSGGGYKNSQQGGKYFRYADYWKYPGARIMTGRSVRPAVTSLKTKP